MSSERTSVESLRGPALLSVPATAGFLVVTALLFVYSVPTVAAVIMALVVVSSLVLYARAAVRIVRAYRNARAELERTGTDISGLFEGLKGATADSESVSRKLAAQVGETLASTARISSQTKGAQAGAQSLSEQVSGGAGAVEQIQASVESLAERIRTQDGTIEQSATAIEQMSASIESVASVAQTKRQASESLRQLTESGSAKVQTTERVINEVTESVSGINQMIQVINDIAAQTNLLAMNAAIEAAHAGEAGRGFAVVAEEIRNLAETTAQNAGDIGATLKELTSSISEAQAASTETGEAFRSIESGAQSVAEAFEEITASTSELSTGAGEVVQATESMRRISGEIVGSVEEMKTGAAEVTSVLGSARDAAQSTSEHMTSINEAAATVNAASNRISELSVQNNDRISELLSRLEEFQGGDAPAEREARERLDLSNIILKHMSWVSRTRAAIDGKITEVPADLLDHKQCDLGRWLAGRGKEVISDDSSYNRLFDTHKRLHEHVENIFHCEECGDVEEEFQNLLSDSRSIVEMLTGYQTGSFVEWTPAIAVDVSAFDAHHRKLFALIDRLYKAMQAGAAKSALSGIFDELLDYTGYHFGAENAAFEHFGYPLCEKHRAEHKELVEKASTLRQQLDEDKPMVAVEVMEFLRDWITNHIRGCDKLYSGFFADKDVDAFLESRSAS